MKGLVLKDIFNARISLALYMVATMLIGIVSGEAFLISMMVFFYAMLLALNVSYDEKVDWETLAISMPFSRRDLALSKYLSLALYMFIASVTSLLGQFFYGLFSGRSVSMESLTTLFYFVNFSIIIASIQLPLLYHFGEKIGRIVTIISVFLTFFGGGVLSNNGFFVEFSHSFRQYGGYLLLGITMISLISSIAISLKIYQHKEL